MILERNLVSDLRKHLEKEEISLIIGPRQAGKTTVLHQLENYLKLQNQNCFFLNLEDPDYLTLLNQSPKNLFQIFPINLKKKSYLLIDEIQYLNDPSNFLKYFFDQYGQKIKILASGSSAFFLDKKFRDSLVGRKKIFTMLSLNFREFLKFKAEPQLSLANFNQLTLSEKEKIEVLFLEYLTYGGYPKVVLSSPEEKIEVLRDLTYSYIKKDIYEANIRQDEIFLKLLKILAEQVGNLVNSFELSHTLGVSKTAIDNYLYVMQKSFHLTLVPPFFKNVRKELTKMPKIYFLDLGLRNFLKNDFRPFLERDDKGSLLENSAYRQLSDKYGQENLKYWRTADRKEIDFVIENSKQAFEVKTQTKRLKPNDYKIFKENYPSFKLNFISLANIWQI